MKVKVESSDCCVVRLGPIARSDPDTELHIAQEINGEWKRVKRVYIEGEKLIRFPDLKPGKYHCALFGGKIAGVATTAEHELPFPFNVFLDTPEDHSRDFLRLDIPAGKPVLPDLARSIKAALNSHK